MITKEKKWIKSLPRDSSTWCIRLQNNESVNGNLKNSPQYTTVFKCCTAPPQTKYPLTRPTPIDISPQIPQIPSFFNSIASQGMLVAIELSRHWVRINQRLLNQQKEEPISYRTNKPKEYTFVYLDKPSYNKFASKSSLPLEIFREKVVMV